MTDDEFSTTERLRQALADSRAELAAVKAERDRLQKQIAALGDMQTETIVLDDDSEADTQIAPALPSLEELMANLDSIAEADDPRAHSNSGLDSSIEMLAPELVFPDGIETDPGALTVADAPLANPCLLILADADPPLKFPLYKRQTTIGRSETADISIDSMHVSRVHARIELGTEGAFIEDVASKNGIKINARRVTRHLLRHGDVLSLGRLRFRFIETA